MLGQLRQVGGYHERIGIGSAGVSIRFFWLLRGIGRDGGDRGGDDCAVVTIKHAITTCLRGATGTRRARMGGAAGCFEAQRQPAIFRLDKA